MARNKNAERGHFIAVYSAATTDPPADSEFKELAKYISEVDDSTKDKTTDDAFYDGDGTPETTVESVQGSWQFKGFYDPTDEAQKIISAMKYEIGDNRLVWHRVVSSDGLKSWTQIATATGIKCGDGAADEYEAFEVELMWNKKPIEKAITPTA